MVRVPDPSAVADLEAVSVGRLVIDAVVDSVMLAVAVPVILIVRELD